MSLGKLIADLNQSDRGEANAEKVRAAIDSEVCVLIQPVVCEVISEAVELLNRLGHRLTIFEAPCHYADYSSAPPRVRLWLASHIVVTNISIKGDAKQEGMVIGENHLERVNSRFSYDSFSELHTTEDTYSLAEELCRILRLEVVTRVSERIVPSMLGDVRAVGLEVEHVPNDQVVELIFRGATSNRCLIVDPIVVGHFGKPSSDDASS